MMKASRACTREKADTWATATFQSMPSDEDTACKLICGSGERGGWRIVVKKCGRGWERKMRKREVNRWKRAIIKNVEFDNIFRNIRNVLNKHHPPFTSLLWSHQNITPTFCKHPTIQPLLKNMNYTLHHPLLKTSSNPSHHHPANLDRVVLLQPDDVVVRWPHATFHFTQAFHAFHHELEVKWRWRRGGLKKGEKMERREKSEKRHQKR